MQTPDTHPIFRNKALSSLNVPRRYRLPVILLRALSLIPCLLGFTYNTKAAWNVDERDAGGAIYLYNTKRDYWVATLWCALAGYWSWILMTSMIRRWLYHYEVNNAIVRLLTLIVLNWSTSAFISSKGGSPTKIWMTICFVLLICNILKLVIGNSPKYHRKVEDVHVPRINLKSTVVKVLVLPLFFVTCVTMFVGIQQVDRLLYTTSQLLLQQTTFLLDKSSSLSASLSTSSSSGMVIMVLIFSSWTKESAQRRDMLRNTSLKLLTASSSLSEYNNNAKPKVVYRFIVGQPPSAWAQYNLGTGIIKESELYHDMLVVPTSDLQDHSSWKLFEALRWSMDTDYHYLIKTNDDVFVRWDRLLTELNHQGYQSEFWKGLVYRNPKEKLNADYGIPTLPAFTSGTLYTLSKNMVERIVKHHSTHRYTKREDENLAMWLFGLAIQPIHDKRIQDIDVCNEDQIAKQFKTLSSMETMYKNIQQQQPQCQGIQTTYQCAVCYPCFDKSDDWRSLNFQCDNSNGVLPYKIEYEQVPVEQVKDNLTISEIGKNDEWIIENVLSHRTSIYSDGEDWSLVYWVCWTSEPSTFTERHWRALELVWVHEPRAVIFMISNTLPQSFFDDYTKYGYNINVVHFNKQNLLNWKWYFGPGTMDWLSQWEKWEKGKHFYWHLTDYIRCLLLYNYGGTYMDMDALWIRIPPDRNVEFIGSDYSKLKSDYAWTLNSTDGLYLPQGVMRFKRGWKLFREMAESAFSAYTYDPECFNCGGPKAITTYVKHHLLPLQAAGFTILPQEVLYPVSYDVIHKYLLPDPLAEQELGGHLMDSTWNIHLFGKMTNKLKVQKGSIADLVLRAFDLDLPHRNAKTGEIISSTKTMQVPMKLMGPRDYIYKSPSTSIASSLSDNNEKKPLITMASSESLISTPGKLQGLNVIYIRGGVPIMKKVIIQVEVVMGQLQIGIPHQDMNVKHELILTDVTQKDVNAILNSLYYIPHTLHLANGGKDRLEVTISYENELGVIQEKDSIEVAVIIVEAND
ncbi:galactosyltransferase-domain-containing protein [Cunninghamella echinulata]|nr:galactosyltransferase-domain-containing protein [Cunninghamella echinulata]